MTYATVQFSRGGSLVHEYQQLVAWIGALADSLKRPELASA
jgi:hypothetical protein